ncbi:MAG: tRNA (N(6)-L-threonylcarbamoyladenosine(37)-C(2))-methylthiotransferase MtaB [Clostridia bacterium]|nr:tRNA (N(6)-L-threonylcarbamoyladenosine(37)-C(2))-methylthiotransferase MtaB [Clostridia bacterium]
MKVYFQTLGCKVNQYETQALRERFLAEGHSAAVTLAEADIIIINSCTVTAESDRKTRQLVRKCRRQNPTATIVLTGCMAQAFPEKAKKLTEADIIIGNKDPEKTVKLALNFKRGNDALFEVDDHIAGETYNTPVVTDFSERTRAYMKIEDGCERYCTYCAIPKARGPVRSRDIESIKTETVALAQKGFREVVLVGINLSAYGKDAEYNLCDAVEVVCAEKNILRVRLGSLEPDHITDKMLERLAAQPKFCPQFHLSLQSGCDATLERMNRKYDSAFYRDLIQRIRSRFPDASITTDVMVGFAGETDEEFEQSLAFVKEIGFAKAHVFMYSRREGTVAAALKNQVQNAVKEERSRRMIEATEKSENECLSQMIGNAYPVLFETADNGFAVGYTPQYARVYVESNDPFTGKIKTVRITKVKNDHCFGVIV